MKRLLYVAVAAFLLSACPMGAEAGKKKKKKKKKSKSGSAPLGAMLLNDENFSSAIKGKGAFVKFLAPW